MYIMFVLTKKKIIKCSNVILGGAVRVTGKSADENYHHFSYFELDVSKTKTLQNIVYLQVFWNSVLEPPLLPLVKSALSTTTFQRYFYQWTQPTSFILNKS